MSCCMSPERISDAQRDNDRLTAVVTRRSLNIVEHPVVSVPRPDATLDRLSLLCFACIDLSFRGILRGMAGWLTAGWRQS